MDPVDGCLVPRSCHIGRWYPSQWNVDCFTDYPWKIYVPKHFKGVDVFLLRDPEWRKVQLPDGAAGLASLDQDTRTYSVFLRRKYISRRTLPWEINVISHEAAHIANGVAYYWSRSHSGRFEASSMITGWLSGWIVEKLQQRGVMATNTAKQEPSDKMGP